MTDRELALWAILHGWKMERGAGMIVLVSPESRTFETRYVVSLDRDGMPVLDDDLRAAIREDRATKRERDRAWRDRWAG